MPLTTDMMQEPTVRDPLAAAFKALEDAENADPVAAAKVRGLMRGYVAKWESSDRAKAIVAVEETEMADLYNPDTQRTSRTFRKAGKIDVKFFDAEGKYCLIDHKTTSDDIEDPASAYWKQLIIEAQPNHYMLLEWLNARKVEYALWDVVRKPSISPKEIAKKDLEALITTATYCGFNLSEEHIDEAIRTKRESLRLYEYRLAQDCTQTRPERYFQRRRLNRLDHELGEYAQELWAHAQEIIAARREDRWMRNSGACMNYGRPCQFLGICSGHDTPDSQQWVKKEFVHNELIQIGDSDGRDLLTNSRVRTFQTCRRKHFYQYELGIERVDGEESEALHFGNLWHIAQEAYWLAIKQEQSHDTSEQASAVSCAATQGPSFGSDQNEDPCWTF